MKTLNKDSKKAIIDVYKTYENLTQEQKEKVNNFEKLIEAKSVIESLELVLTQINLGKESVEDYETIGIKGVTMDNIEKVRISIVLAKENKQLKEQEDYLTKEEVQLVIDSIK